MDKYLISKLRKISPLQLKELFAKKGYTFFDKESYLNIIGVRNLFKGADLFRDALILVYKKENIWRVFLYPFCTDFNNTMFNKLLHRKGIPILAKGQYINMFSLEKNQMFIQRIEIPIYKDSSKENGIFMDENHLVVENSHLCIYYNDKNKDINPGSQIFESKIDYTLFWNICQKSTYELGNLFTYTLLDTDDLSLIKF